MKNFLLILFLILLSACTNGSQTSKFDNINLDELKEIWNINQIRNQSSNIVNEDKLTKLIDYQLVSDTYITPKLKYNIQRGDREELRKVRENQEMHNQLYEYFNKITPKDYRVEIVEFSIGTDGNASKSAELVQTKDNYEQWDLIIDPYDSYNFQGGKILKEKYIYTTLEIIARSIQVRNSELEIYPELHNKGGKFDEELFFAARRDCFPMYATREGCYREDSINDDFYKIFWDDIIDEHYDYLDRYQDLKQIYIRYSDRFINERASLSPDQDFIESFTAFILLDKPTGNKIKYQKIEFFYKEDEFIQLREKIRNNILNS